MIFSEDFFDNYELNLPSEFPAVQCPISKVRMTTRVFVEDYLNKEECVICSDKYCDKDINNISRTICRHKFHTNCLNDWLSSQREKYINGTCPICRNVLEETNNRFTFHDGDLRVSDELMGTITEHNTVSMDFSFVDFNITSLDVNNNPQNLANNFWNNLSDENKVRFYHVMRGILQSEENV